MSDASVYKSKVDWWLAVIIIALFLYGLASLGWGVYLFITGGPLNIWLLAAAAFVVLLIVGFVWPMEYTLLKDELLVRNGLFRSRYKYEIITGIKPSRNPISSPALSLDRVKISYKGIFGLLLISPEDKESFMKDLASRTQHLVYTNGEVKTK